MIWFPNYCGARLYALPAIKYVLCAYFYTQRQFHKNFVFKALPTEAASLVISVAAVPKAIVSSNVLFASFIADDERVKNSMMSPLLTLWLFKFVTFAF